MPERRIGQYRVNENVLLKAAEQIGVPPQRLSAEIWRHANGADRNRNHYIDAQELAPIARNLEAKLAKVPLDLEGLWAPEPIRYWDRMGRYDQVDEGASIFTVDQYRWASTEKRSELAHDIMKRPRDGRVRTDFPIPATVRADFEAHAESLKTQWVGTLAGRAKKAGTINDETKFIAAISDDFEARVTNVRSVDLRSKQGPRVVGWIATLELDGAPGLSQDVALSFSSDRTVQWWASTKPQSP